MKVCAREQSAYTTIEQPCSVVVRVLPESDLRKSELHYPYTRLERTTEPT